MKHNITSSLFMIIISIGLVACDQEIPQQIMITLTTTEGEATTYEVNIVELDTTAPEVISSYPENVDPENVHTVDPKDVLTNGITVVFSEPVSGELFLLDGDDFLPWWKSKTDGNTITLTSSIPYNDTIIVHEDGGYSTRSGLAWETLHTIQGTVADNAGNKAKVYLTFITSAFPFRNGE